ncbi:MAG: hypothetical protein EZS26_000968 [Candidatus Ordinivivax streblomastigis]|uniref:Uncharacterized protein n=1 Tax=Candidatus Ordinivivax streblomastigis TaxID=2540710 RepID=A0A5M8P343_9BACT|nr:MAG: hypothetical protein EZS26_000968 [Candidatus Ordinivivax streblomastigis]
MNKQDSEKYLTYTILQLMVNYQTLMQEYSDKVNEVISGKQTASLICPDYASEVVIPVIKLLAKALPESNITIPNRENYGLSGGYYGVYAGNKLIGGFLHPADNESKLLFSPALHRCISTEKQEIADIQHLIDLIKSNICREMHFQKKK